MGGYGSGGYGLGPYGIGGSQSIPSIETYKALVTSEHNQQPKFMAMLEALLQPFVDIQILLSSFPDIFNLDFAEGDQLDKIGEWVGVSRFIRVPIPNVFFTFDDPDLGFDQAAWFGPGSQMSGITALYDGIYRTVIRAKIAADHWDGTVPGAYAAWNLIFSSSRTHFSIQGQTLLPYLDTNTEWTMPITIPGFFVLYTSGSNALASLGPLSIKLVAVLDTSAVLVSEEQIINFNGTGVYGSIQIPVIEGANLWKVYYGTHDGGEDHHVDFPEITVASLNRIVPLNSVGVAGTPPAPSYKLDPGVPQVITVSDPHNPVNWMRMSQALASSVDDVSNHFPWAFEPHVGLTRTLLNIIFSSLTAGGGNPINGPLWARCSKFVAGVETTITPESGPWDSGGSVYLKVDTPVDATASKWRLYFGYAPGALDHYLEVSGTSASFTINSAGTAGRPSIIDGLFPAPDKTVTAQQVDYDGTVNGSDLKLKQIIGYGASTGVPFTISIYLRAEIAQTIQISDGNAARVDCILTTDWRRYSFTVLGDNTHTLALYIYSPDGIATQFQAWGAQAERGSLVTDYAVNSIRKVGSATYGMPAGPTKALITPRRNLAQYSEDLTQAVWQSSISGTGVAPTITFGSTSNATMPYGLNPSTCSRIQLNRGAGTSNVNFSGVWQSCAGGPFAPVIGGDSYLLSIWVKLNTGTTPVLIQMADLWSGGYKVWAVDNRWQRITLPVLAHSSGNIGIGLFAIGSLTQQTADLLVWGAQVEKGTELGRYIPTTIVYPLAGVIHGIQTDISISPSGEVDFLPSTDSSYTNYPYVSSNIKADYAYFAYQGVLIYDYQDMTMKVALYGTPPDAVTKALFNSGFLGLTPAGVSVTYEDNT